MGAVVESREFVFDGVAVPVLTAPAAHNIIVGYRTRPHDVGTHLVVGGVGNGARPFLEHRQEQAFAKAVGRLDLERIREIAFKDVRHDVGNAASRLVRRQRAKQSRVLHREFRANHVRANIALEHAVFLGHHGSATAFGTRGRNRLHHANRERLRDRELMRIKIPEVAIVKGTHGDALGAIDRGAATNGKDEIYPVCTDRLDALVDERIARVRLNTAEFHVRDANSVERSLYAVNQAGAHCGSAAVMNEHLRAAILFNEFTAFLFAVHAEDEFRGAVEIEIFHIPSFFC